MLAPRSFARREAKPKADPRFVAATDAAKVGAAKLKQHPPVAQKARQASKSAKAPANERLASAKAKVVDAIKAAPAPKPKTETFKALLRAEINKAMPQTLGDTESFMDGGAKGQMTGALSGGVASQKAAATGPSSQAVKQPPDAASVPAQPSTALPAEPQPLAPAVPGTQAMPLPARPDEVSLQATKQDTDDALKDEKIKPESLPKANDARFSGVAAAKSQVAAQADRAPAVFRAREAGLLGAAGKEAGVIARRGALLMGGRRSQGNARVLTRQQQQAAKEEAERLKVATTVEAIYSRSKTRVEAKLAGLEAEVSALFDPGVDAALSAMKRFVDNKLHAYKVDRYLSIPFVGAARWLRDQFRGLPDEVSAFYTQGRAVFQQGMDALIDRIANLVEQRLGEAKAEVAAGQAEIKGYVAGLPANLQAAGQAAEKSMSERFAELSQGIEDKKNELAAGLAQKYKEAFDKADAALKAIQDENKGLVAGFIGKLVEIVKALLAFKDKLLSLLKKGMDAIQLILDDPIGFLGNLLAAVKGGFQAFVNNIWTHLKAGFMQWLFGAMAGMGITLPNDLSLVSVFKLVLDVLGITYDKMRAKAVTLIGARAVTVIEKVAEYLKDLITGGVAKLWAHVKDDLASLKDMVIGAIMDWLIDTVVKQAVTKIVSMFNPAGAIVQAIIAIYNVIMFVVEKAQQLMALIEAVVNSVYAIASGSIGSAIAWIEKSLAATIPVVIGFLARLLGLSGISEKIQGFIKKVQSKVDAAIDKVIVKIAGMVKKLFGAVKAGVKTLLQWWKKKLPFTGGGESHALDFQGEEKSAQLMVNSKKKPVTAFVLDFVDIKGTADEQAQAKAWDVKITATQQQLRAANEANDDAKLESLSKLLDTQLEALSLVLQGLLNKGASLGGPDNPLLIDYPKRRASAYPVIYAGPRVGEGLRIHQAWLKPLVGKSNAAAKTALLSDENRLKKNSGFAAWTGQVIAFSPLAQTTLGGKPLGLASQFAALGPGKLLNYSVKEGTGGGSKVNDIFRPYGFVPSSKSGEGLDGDHVLERQLGGPDEPANLWPLDKSENRSSGSTIKSMQVTVKKQAMSVHQAKDDLKKKQSLYLLIRSTRG